MPRLPLAATALLLLACAAHAGEHMHGNEPGVQSLDVYAGAGRAIHLLTCESRDDENRDAAKTALLHRRSNDGGETWSSPTSVGKGQPPPFSPHRGADPQIAAAGERLIAVWTTAGTDAWGSGPMATALSDDSGRTWRAGPNPADDSSTTGHGFIDIAADSAGVFHLTWLDSRDGKQGLRYARSTDSGKSWSRNSSLKSGTCECCPNALATGADNAVAILFRDGSPRDMALSFSSDAGNRWVPPVRVGRFDWNFNGCPHVGGGLAFMASALHAVVWSGVPEHAGVHHLASSDSGVTWSKPHRFGSATASHPDIATTADQHVAAVWDDDSGGGTRAIWSAISSDDGASWGAPMQLSEKGGNATHARIMRAGTSFRVFWTEDRGEQPAVWISKPMQ